MGVIMHKNILYGGGSTIEPNPQESATEQLETLGIDGDVYEVTDANAIHTSDVGVANGVASLDVTGRVPSTQLPSYVDDVLEYASQSAFPATGESGKIYIALDTNKTYRWSGSAYVEISESLALGEMTGTAYEGSKGKANADNIASLQTDMNKAYKTDDSAETDLQDTDYIPFYDTSATAKKKSLWSNIKAKLKAYFDTLYDKTPTLAAVATSGSYNDLSNKPTIPTVNNGTLTIQKNGTNVQTFSANQSGNATANITVPTKTSDLNNDSNFVDTTDLNTKVSKAGDTITGVIKPSTDRTLNLGDASNRFHYIYASRVLAVESINNSTTYNVNQISVPQKSGTMALISDIDTRAKKVWMNSPQPTSYRRGVIALCEVSTTAQTELNSYTAGRITFHRHNGLNGMRYINFAIENGYYNSYGVNATNMGANLGRVNTPTLPKGTGWAWCVFKHNDKWYGGIEVFISDAELNNVDIDYIGNFTPFGFAWYNTSSSTVIDSEFADSVKYDVINKVNGSFMADGFSGTFSGNLVGNADTATTAGTADKAKELNNWYTSRPTSANVASDSNGGIRKFLASSSMTTGKPQADGHIIQLDWDSAYYGSQLYVPAHAGDHMQFRCQDNNTWPNWCTLIDSNNISSQSVDKATKDGDGNVISSTYAKLANSFPMTAATGGISSSSRGELDACTITLPTAGRYIILAWLNYPTNQASGQSYYRIECTDSSNTVKARNEVPSNSNRAVEVILMNFEVTSSANEVRKIRGYTTADSSYNPVRGGVIAFKIANS